MIIRKGEPGDAAYMADYLIQAGKDIYRAHLKSDNIDAIHAFLKRFAAEPGNQVSYHHWWIAVIEEKPVGGMLIYKSGQPDAERDPIVNAIKAEFNPDFHAEKEAETDEYYLDSIGVNPAYQGQGVGGALINRGIQTLVREQGETLGLLVDTTNPEAERLYTRLGFEAMGTKHLAGHELKHMQVKPSNTE